MWPKWLNRARLPLGPVQKISNTDPEPDTYIQEICDPVFTVGKPPIGLGSGLIAWSESPSSGQPGFWYRPNWPECDIIFDLASFLTEIIDS